MKASRDVYGGGDKWFSEIVVTATGAADLKLCPAATANGRTRRLVVLRYHISGHNTNAAATTYVIRNKTTTANIMLGGSMIPLTGATSRHGECELPAVAGEDIELNVAGAITGQINVTLEGVVISQDLPVTRNFTGVP